MLIFTFDASFRSFLIQWIFAKLNSESYDSMQSWWWFALQFNQNTKAKLWIILFPLNVSLVAFPFQLIDRFPYMATRAHIHFRALLLHLRCGGTRISDWVSNQKHAETRFNGAYWHTSMNYWTSTRFSWLLLKC